MLFCSWGDCRGKHLRLRRKILREKSLELTKIVLPPVWRSQQRGINAPGVGDGNDLRDGHPRVRNSVYYAGSSAAGGNGYFAQRENPYHPFAAKALKKLRKYAKDVGISSGIIFLARGGRSLSRKQIWAEMKAISQKAAVTITKVFLHNLRHLFAQCFYRANRDVVKPADILDHSSVETTRLYLVSAGVELDKNLNMLRLVC